MQAHEVCVQNSNYLLLLCTIQAIILDTRINSVWQGRIPNDLRFSSTVERIINVVEVKETGFDIYANGRHKFYQHIINVRQVNEVHSLRGNGIQLSIGKVYISNLNK